jgi:hypothetical protein
LAIGAQSNYVLEHILRPFIHPHLKPQMFGFVVELQLRATQTRRGSNASLCDHSRCASDCCMQRSTSADVNYDQLHDVLQLAGGELSD